MKTWERLQLEVSVWALHNFGQQQPFEPTLGVVEELGEFFSPDTSGSAIAERIARIDALGDQSIYALNLLDKCGISMEKDITQPHWSRRPHRYSDREIVGALALTCHGVLKHHQGIRGMDFSKRKEVVTTSMSIWYKWAQYQCIHLALPPLLEITNTVWESVQKRDWKKHPEDANVNQ